MENKIESISDDFLNAALLLRMIRNDGARQPGLKKSGKILACIKSGQPITEKALADQCGVSPMRLKKWLKIMEYEGLIELADKGDNMREVTLTEIGNKKAEKIEKRRAKAESMFECLSEEDRRKLSNILDQLLPVLMQETECDEDDLDSFFAQRGFESFAFGRHHLHQCAAGFMGSSARFHGSSFFD